MEGVSQELYEQIKVEAIEEWKEQKRREAKKREEQRIAERIAIDKLFEPTRSKYYIKVYSYVNLLCRAGQRLNILQTIEEIFSEAEQLALQAIGERSKESAYKNNRAGEANKMAEQMLETKIYIPQKSHKEQDNARSTDGR